MKQLVVISGKGGTGKTSIVAALAALAENKVLADCDVDAADLHLILNPEIQHSEDFSGGSIAELDKEKCIECGKCLELCRFSAIDENYNISRTGCEGCGVCAHFCPADAISMHEKISGKWFVSDTRFGPLVHAKLGIAEDNSGKLVSRVKDEAKKTAEAGNHSLIIIDGSPGIGCPVIASIAGASAVLIVTEPTVSGLHDMERVAELTGHFKIRTFVCINKFDLNADITKRTEQFCADSGTPVIGKIPYMAEITKAQIAAQSIIEFAPDNPAAREIQEMWKILRKELE
ncbi:MAG TPA: 4Fe-4S binding protein [Spirochaetota bacterium]|nr:4Fe-4S binding protein [Spirochaetota bacterium]HQP48450.1 4Fe-4S binding protein [Spirochaetota bacterium]